jgi:hypothetical protein
MWLKKVNVVAIHQWPIKQPDQRHNPINDTTQSTTQPKSQKRSHRNRPYFLLKAALLRALTRAFSNNNIPSGSVKSLTGRVEESANVFSIAESGSRQYLPSDIIDRYRRDAEIETRLEASVIDSLSAVGNRSK